METTTSKISVASEVLKKLAVSKDESKMKKREIVLSLKKDIVAARTAGKSWSEIVQALQEAGISVTAQHIKTCLQTTKKKSNEKTAKQTGKEKKSVGQEADNARETPVANTANTKVTGMNKVRPDSVNL